jgi:methionine-rich copper-binding protein CopC
MKKLALFTGMILMVAFMSTTVFAQDKTTTQKPAEKTTTTKTTTTTSTDKKDASKEGCKPGCTMSKDKKCCDKDKKTPATPEKK